VLLLHISAGWDSPWDCAAYVALREKGLRFATSLAILREGQGVMDLMRERTITGSAPALQHGDFWLSESLAIIEYLEEAFPPPAWPRLLPAGLRERTRARQLMTWLRTMLYELRRERASSWIFYPGAALAPLSDAGRRQAQALVRVAVALGAGPSGALFGEFCSADCDLAFTLKRLVDGDVDVPPALRAYADAVWARPSVAEFVGHRRPPHPL
jgi:glutathione S-transferase